jgi:hypothetical protein
MKSTLTAGIESDVRMMTPQSAKRTGGHLARIDTAFLKNTPSAADFDSPHSSCAQPPSLCLKGFGMGLRDDSSRFRARASAPKCLEGTRPRMSFNISCKGLPCHTREAPLVRKEPDRSPGPAACRVKALSHVRGGPTRFVKRSTRLCGWFIASASKEKTGTSSRLMMRVDRYSVSIAWKDSDQD